jgi:hypothetical protein
MAKTLMLRTELPSQDHAGLDQYPVADLVDTLIADQFNAVAGGAPGGRADAVPPP